MRSSCIEHPENEPMIIIRKWQREACDNNKCAAALLSYLEYWHNNKLASIEQNRHWNQVAEQHGEKPTQLVTLYQWHKEEELIEGIQDLFKRDAIREALKLLEVKGFLEVTTNPTGRYKFDRTRYFLLKPDEINKWLKRRKSAQQQSSSSNQPTRSSNQPTRSSNQPTRSDNPHSSIQENTTEITTEITYREGEGKPAPPDYLSDIIPEASPPVLPTSRDASTSAQDTLMPEYAQEDVFRAVCQMCNHRAAGMDFNVDKKYIEIAAVIRRSGGVERLNQFIDWKRRQKRLAAGAPLEMKVRWLSGDWAEFVAECPVEVDPCPREPKESDVMHLPPEHRKDAMQALVDEWKPKFGAWQRRKYGLEPALTF